MKKMLLLISSLFFAISFADEFVEDGTTTIGGYGELHLDMENENMDLIIWISIDSFSILNINSILSGL